MKNVKGWKVTALEYDHEKDETCIVCGGNRRYRIPDKWTPEMMIYALQKLQMRGKDNV